MGTAIILLSIIPSSVIFNTPIILDFTTDPFSYFSPIKTTSTGSPSPPWSTGCNVCGINP